MDNEDEDEDAVDAAASSTGCSGPGADDADGCECGRLTCSVTPERRANRDLRGGFCLVDPPAPASASGEVGPEAPPLSLCHGAPPPPLLPPPLRPPLRSSPDSSLPDVECADTCAV